MAFYLRVPTTSSLLATAARALAQFSASPRLDAELLMERATKLDRTRQRSHPDQELNSAQRTLFEALLQRRMQGEPLAYILGERGFWSLDLEVSPAVLIPRPETERLVECALGRLPERCALRVLDLGTGSGAIALAIARERPLAQVMATDRSAAALEVARRNAARLQLLVEFIESDWYTAVPAERFDLIVSNPPYIAADDPNLDARVLASEPRHALIAGPSGLEMLRAITAGAPAHLAADGWLMLEHGWRQGAAVRELLVDTGFNNVASHADLAGHERVTTGRWPR